AVQLAQTPDTKNFFLLAVLRWFQFSDKGDLAVVIVEANARQPFVRDALRKIQRAEVTVINTFFRQRLVELHQQWLVFGTDRAGGDRRLVFQFPRHDILHRIRPDGRLGQLVLRRFRIVQHDARIERKNSFRRDEQRIDVNLRDPRLLDDELAEAHEQLFERGDVRGLASAHAFERGENFGAFHHAARQRRVQRRQTKRAVLENLDELAARAEEQHRAELRINAAANNQFITFELDHRLHGHAKEMFLANFFGDGRFDGFPRLTDGGGRAQI